MNDTQNSEKSIEFVINDDSTLTEALLTFVKAWFHYKLEDEGLAKHVHDMLGQESSVKYLKDELQKVIDAHKIKPYELHGYVMNRPSFYGSRDNHKYDEEIAQKMVEFYASDDVFGKLINANVEQPKELLTLLTNPNKFIEEINTMSQNVIKEFTKALFESYSENIDEIKSNIREYMNITGNKTIYLDQDIPEECYIPDLTHDMYDLCRSLGIDLKEEAIKFINEDESIQIEISDYAYNYDYSERYLANSVTWSMTIARYECSLYHSDGKFFMPNEDLIKDLIPGGGKCDTKLGEMLRACQGVLYRFFNDGDTATNISEANTIDYANLLFMVDEWLTEDNFDTLKNAWLKISKDETYRERNRYGLFSDVAFSETDPREAVRRLVRYLYDCGGEGAAVQCAMEMEILLIQCYLDNPEFLNEHNSFDSRCYKS